MVEYSKINQLDEEGKVIDEIVTIKTTKEVVTTRTASKTELAEKAKNLNKEIEEATKKVTDLQSQLKIIEDAIKY